MLTWEESMRHAASGQQLMETVLQYAVQTKGSDIHIEPLEEQVRVRLRIDGVLMTAGELPKERLHALTTRIKIMANLDIANKITPQDGRFTWKQLDMRVSTMPTIRGEKTVIRILDGTKRGVLLDSLGMNEKAYTLFRRLLQRRQGLLLVSGPTGSGKSTTLYAALQELDDPSLSIATLEDPVEYAVPGISQSQIHVKQGLEFHNGLRALLRQDPDILVIGEIRDAETAQMAVRAALTGHMVLSTVHTATAADVPLRLMDMGIAPYLLAEALIGLTSQRLVRQLCSCAVPDPEGVYRAAGCDACLHRGYVGRICISEVIPVGLTVRKCIRQKEDAMHIADAARKEGAVLFDDAISEALEQGLTDRMEIMRVFGL